MSQGHHASRFIHWLDSRRRYDLPSSQVLSCANQAESADVPPTTPTNMKVFARASMENGDEVVGPPPTGA